MPDRATTAAAAAKRQLQHGGAHQQVPAEHQLAPQRGGRGRRSRSDAPARGPAPGRTAPPATRLTGDVGQRRADQAQPERVHQQRAEHDPDPAAGQHVAHRPAQLLDPAQPAVAGQRDQQQRQARAGDPQPLLAGVGDRPGAAGEQPGQRPGRQLEQQRQRDAEGQRPARSPARPRATAPARSPAPVRRAARAVVP